MFNTIAPDTSTKPQTLNPKPLHVPRSTRIKKAMYPEHDLNQDETLNLK